MSACARCLRRTALLASLGAHIELARARGLRLPGLLGLGDEQLIAALAPGRGHELRVGHEAFDPAIARAAVSAVGLRTTCRCEQARYPPALRALPDPPAVIHMGGGRAGKQGGLARLEPGRSVAVVGARRASRYGLEVAHRLGRDLALAGACVVSGLALGVDAAAHEGAVEAGGQTVAVLGGGADVPYPAGKRPLYDRILAAEGLVISEMPPGFRAFRWSFPARNRIIAALCSVTVVVEAAERSGSLITADLAGGCGREVGAVPGRVTAPMSVGTNALLADGAHVVRDAADVLGLLDELAPAGLAPAARAASRAGLEPRLRTLLEAVASGQDTLEAVSDGPGARSALSGLSELELLGLLRRRPGGRYVLV